MIQRPLKALSFWFIAAVILLATVTGCGAPGQWQFYHRIEISSQVPPELTTFWEAWKLLQKDYGGKETLDQRQLQEGAIQGMLSAVGNDGAKYVSPEEYDPTAPDMGGVWQAWRALMPRLKEAGVDVSPQKLEEGAIHGMLGALDNPYTSYLSPEEYTSQLAGFESKYEGVGLYVGSVGNQITVVSPIPDTPADRAGITAGDIIVEVDGAPMAGLGVAEAAQRIRGPKGTSVELVLQRPGEETLRRITLVREEVTHASVLWKPLGEDLAYLRITEFLDNTDGEVGDALKEILAAGSKGLIVDLRHNPGGLLNTTVNVASQFLNDGLVLYQVSADGTRQDMPVRPGGIARKISMVVLVDRASASASEVLTAALQDHGRAVVLGTRTYGKGSVNELKRLDSGSGMYLTVALWYSPKGRMIEGEGLTPDINVPMDIRVQIGSQDDLQFQAAVEYLMSEVAAPAM